MGFVTRKLLLILLLLCFQTQTLAALALPCAHGGGADTAADACHQPSAAGKSDAPDSPCFDCHKCQLGCAFGVAALPFGRSVVPVPESGPVTGTVFFRHFYRFVPDPLQRPPIPFFS